MVAHDISVDDYPFISICGREFNFIRPAASPIVFHSLVDTNERQNLVFGGYSLVQPFDEVAGMAISEQTGRLYHKLTSHILKPRSGVPNATDSGRQEYGLIRSTVAVSLSERIVAMNENDAGNSGETTTHSGFGFGTSSRKLLPLPWLPTDSEPGPWAMPFTDDE